LSAASKWLTSWEVNGAFNWKTIGEPSILLLKYCFSLMQSRSQRPHWYWDGKHQWLPILLGRLRQEYLSTASRGY
jgi:hypothetical protein